MNQNEINQKLADLQQQKARRQQLKMQIESLSNQRTDLVRQESELAMACAREKGDVERLEGLTLQHLWAYVTGGYDEKLDKETREAYEASVRHETVKQELRSIDEELSRARRERDRLASCEREYERLLEEKKELLKQSDSVHAPEIVRLEERIGELNCKEKEIREAMMAGDGALRIVQDIMNGLDSASGWGTWDLVGGGLISGIAKHSALSDAQSRVNDLQMQLRRFKTELADVEIQADMQLQIGGFLQFADFFFDGIFADVAVLDRISRSKEQVIDVRCRVQNVLATLNQLKDQVGREREQVKDELDKLTLMS